MKPSRNYANAQVRRRFGRRREQTKPFNDTFGGFRFRVLCGANPKRRPPLDRRLVSSSSSSWLSDGVCVAHFKAVYIVNQVRYSAPNRTSTKRTMSSAHTQTGWSVVAKLPNINVQQQIHTSTFICANRHKPINAKRYARARRWASQSRTDQPNRDIFFLSEPRDS